MGNRKVKISLTLVGRSNFNYDKFKDFSNEDVLFLVESQVVEQFGKRPIFISDKKNVTFEGREYPPFYAAGWFISDNPITETDGNGSELVVIAHGEDMKSAKDAMMRAISTVEWDNLARNI
ncbi:MAG: hypothetical protein ACXAC5_05550 [Promethearchaeota archaeon]